IGDEAALLPFGDGLWIDAMALGQGPQALLTTLYRSTDCLCRRGAAMKNLAQSASLHAGENNAPLKPGTKHLVRRFALAHQLRDPVRLRIVAPLERRDNAWPVGRRAVLAQLELAFEAADRDLDPDNALQHRLHIVLRQSLHVPRHRLARLVP